MSGIFTYPATLNKLKRKAESSATKMARGILRMIVDPQKIREAMSLKEIDERFPNAAVGK